MFDNTISNLEGGLRKSAAKQAVTAQNISNAETPGYAPLDFDEELGKAVKRQGNKKVILEEEMSNLSQNSVRYSAYVKLLTQKFNILRSVVTQGRK